MSDPFPFDEADAKVRLFALLVVVAVLILISAIFEARGKAEPRETEPASRVAAGPPSLDDPAE